MRGVSLLALLACAVSLAGCASGGSGSSILASNIDVCGLSCNKTPGGDEDDDDADTDPPPDGDGDGLADDDDDDGDTGSGAGGNTTGLTTGNTTITLQEGKQNKPTGGKGLSTLATVESGTLAQTTTAILSSSKPVRLRMSTDTKTATNGEWAVPVFMDEYKYGTQNTTWFTRGHYRTGQTIVDSFGNDVGVWDPVELRYETPSATFNGTALSSSFFRDPFYAAQIMDSRANGGAGTGYREYRVISEADNRDELLQVWAWDDSYAIQYRNAIGGGQAKQQAWAFGGNATTAMPTAGSATYNGRFVGTAETENWIKPDGADVDPNAIWQVQGASQINANFGNGQVTGTITPETWSSFQSGKNGWYTWTNSKVTGQSVQSIASATDPNYTTIYDAVINVNATITGNTYTGSANLGDEFAVGDNIVQGGFFGTNAAETTGVFAVDGIAPDPMGGSDGIEDDRRGILNINGAFHGD